MTDRSREGVGVCCSSKAGVEETSWRVPKERYLPSTGGGGGTRFRSSGGSDKRSETCAEIGCVASEVDWPWGSIYFWRLSRFCGVKDL